jgi:threonine dehydrogenase-like Zn-dependent dehydrogenase
VRAVVYHDVGRVRVEEVPDPAPPGPGEAIVRVTVSGICGSDLHFLHGKAPLYAGEAIGHEAVGVVEAVGDRVSRFRPGDRVVVSFTVACGECWFCRAGETSLCESSAIFGTGLFGGRLPGAQAEFLRVPGADVNLLLVPADVEDESALFVGDALATAVYAASIADASADETVAVVGVGPVGLLIVQALVAGGARRVFGLDRERGRLELAEAAGATPVDVTALEPQMALAAATGDRGADAAIDAVGHPDAYATSLDVVRRGGRVVVVGMYAGETVESQLGVQWSRGLTIRFAGICPVHAHWDRAMAGVVAGELDPRPLITHRLPLDEAQLGYELLDRREAIKVLLTP